MISGPSLGTGRAPRLHSAYLDDDLPLDINLTIIFTPEGKPFAGFD
jgi:hypothetical protein